MSLLLVTAVSAGLFTVSASAAGAPVPSLTPSATARLWRAETHRTRPGRQLSDIGCRPARVLFYAQTDWLRVATKLAQTQSPCAEYFVSVPPLAADRTQPRSGQAASIRALGSNFHALDEISYTGWAAWVAAGGGSWFDAGAAARQRMAAAGFDTGSGDTWALNELSSAVRKNAGAARRNALDFLHGLSSDGVKGAVLTAGIGQGTPDLSLYQVNLQDWLQDGAFWTEVAGYTSDWAQESYGDLRDYAAADASPQQRRDVMAQYLGHEQALASAGPATVAPARSLLDQTYVPLGNAAWAWSASYGWTAAPLEVMEDFVSGQVNADRTRAIATGASSDRIGFAWSPSNSLGLTTSDFNAQTAALLDRVAAAIRDSGVPASDPGAAACLPAWCSTVLPGAALPVAWQAFSAWAPTLPAFLTAPVAVAAGTPAGPLTLQLQTLGLPDGATGPRTVSLTSTSPAGAFAASPAGPWTSTVTLALPAGSSTVSVFYLDGTPGTPNLTATLDGGAVTSQTESILPAAPTPLPAPDPSLLPPAAPTTAPVKTPPAARVTAIVTKRVRGHLVVSVRIRSGSTPAAGVRIHIRIRRGSSLVAAVTRTTTSTGMATWRSRRPLPRAHYTVVTKLHSP
ncbi:MAG: hypothetical protein ACXVY8_03600 [Gaiellaceae bacterium]